MTYLELCCWTVPVLVLLLPGCVCSQIPALAPLGNSFPEQMLWPPWLLLLHLIRRLNQHPHPAGLIFQGIITESKAEALNPQKSLLPLTSCLPGSAELLRPSLKFIACSFKELLHRDCNFLYCLRTASFIN